MVFTPRYIYKILGDFNIKNINQITLIYQNDHIVFTPLLYEVITEELQTWEISPSFNQLLKNQKIKFGQAPIQDIDFKTRQVKLLEGGNLLYDYLVIAVGATNGKLPSVAENV